MGRFGDSMEKLQRAMAEGLRNRETWFWLVVSAILVVQCQGLGFGLPQMYHPDEYYINLATFKLFHHIRNFEFDRGAYVLGIRWIFFAGSVLLFVVGRSLGVFDSFADFYSRYYQYGNPYIDSASPWFYLPPRIISFLFYIGCVILIYRLARRMARHDASKHLAHIAVLCALALPGGYLYSHYGTRESAICFCTLFIVYHAYFHFDPGRLRDVAIAGLVLGVSMGIKENAAIFFFLYAWMIFLKRGKTGEWQKVAGKVCLLGFISVAVFLLLNPQWFLHVVNKGMVEKIQGTFWVPANPSPESKPRALPGYSTYPLAFVHEFGIPGLILLLVGAGFLWRSRPELRPLLVMVLGTYVVLDFLNWGRKSDRFMLNVFMPFLLMGLLGLSDLLKGKISHKALWVLPVLFLCFNSKELCSAYLSVNGYDTRDVANRWMQTQLPKNAKIAREIVYTPEVDTSDYRVKLETWRLGSYALDSLRSMDVEYLVFTDHFMGEWQSSDEIKFNYRTFLPYTVKHFDTRYRPKINDFHSPRMWVCKIQ